MKDQTEWFINRVKQEVASKYPISPNDVFVVWYSKTLKNSKALVSFRTNDDYLKGVYIEATYNGYDDELYLDTYNKVENKVIKTDFNK